MIHIVKTIMQSKKDASGFGIILCEVEGVHKYVTWLVDPENNKHHGDYCVTVEAAVNSYFERCHENRVKA